MKSNRFTLILIFFCIALISIESYASDSLNGLSPQEKEIRARVKARAYPGGRDEESLTVQTQLPIPNRKIQPATEPIEPGAPTGADSND
jgi:hypothetical protein